MMKSIIVITLFIITNQLYAQACTSSALAALSRKALDELPNRQVAQMLDDVGTPNASITDARYQARVQQGLDYIHTRPDAFYDTVKTRAERLMQEGRVFNGRRYSSIQDLEAALTRDIKTKISNGEIILAKDGNFYHPESFRNAAGSSPRVEAHFPMNHFIRTADNTGSTASRALASATDFTPDAARARQAVDAIADNGSTGTTSFFNTQGQQVAVSGTVWEQPLEQGSELSKFYRDKLLGSNPSALQRSRWNQNGKITFVVNESNGVRSISVVDTVGNNGVLTIRKPENWGFGTLIAAE